MYRKRILKAIADVLRRPITKVLIYLAGVAFVLGLSGAFTSGQTVWNTFMNIIKSEDTLSLLFAGLVSLGTLKILSWFEGYMEESMKIEDNHHKIIAQYSAHNQYSDKKLNKLRQEDPQLKGLSDEELENYIDNRRKGTFAVKQGEYLMLRHVQETLDAPAAPGEGASKKGKRLYKRQQRRYDRTLERVLFNEDRNNGETVNSAKRYLRGKLGICSVNVFANVDGRTAVRYQDDPKSHELPSFVIAHADELLQAHKNSAKSNSNTIRLRDFDYDEKNDVLTLKTERSTYYHMLITNRCMDYRFANGMSIREVYEYDKEICPFERSKFGNQIGINGLIVTADGYVLVEKRSRKKITWKNKFAQSISLAMKVDDLEMHRWDILGDAPSDVQSTMGKIITKTIKGNFGLLPGEDYEAFQMERNFLGLARDMLEGGKPNLYFYVRYKKTAAELQMLLESNVAITDKNNKEGRPVISKSKLDSDYYLMPFDQIAINFNYCMFAGRKDILRVHRKLANRCGWFAEKWDRAKETVNGIVRPTLKRECGEALLVTLAYMEMCDRWRYPGEEKNNEQ